MNQVRMIAGCVLAACLSLAMPAGAWEKDVIPADPPAKEHVTGALPPVWVLRGDNAQEYAAGTDASVTFAGKPSGFIKSTGFNLSGSGTMATWQNAVPYRGKTVRVTAQVKTDAVQKSAFLWLSWDSQARPLVPKPGTLPDLSLFQFSHPLAGTLDWKHVEVDLPVPADADRLFTGLVLIGRGTAYINNVAITEVAPPAPTAPNLDFGR